MQKQKHRLSKKIEPVCHHQAKSSLPTSYLQMSYSRYDQQEHMRDRYEDYMERHERYKDEVYYEEQGESRATHTTSGAPLDKLVHVTNIPYCEGGFAAVNWNPATNQFLVCEPGQDDWVIDRTETTLRAFAQILAFNPKEWGCWRCGCSAEFKDQERVCGCDMCQKDGCITPMRLEVPELAPSRVKSHYFKKRELSSLPPLPLPPPPPPPMCPGPLQRFMTLGDLEQPVNPIGVIMEDDEQDRWFRNPVDRANMFKGS
jgi:hypothetical protein